MPPGSRQQKIGLSTRIRYIACALTCPCDKRWHTDADPGKERGGGAHLIVVALVEVTAILRPMRLDQMLDRDKLLALLVTTAW